MKKFILSVILLFVTACGTTSSLKSTSGNSNQSGVSNGSSMQNKIDLDLRDYDVLYVKDFEIEKTGLSKDDEILSVAAKEFTDKIASAIRRKGTFSKVMRKPVKGKALVIEGDLLKYKEGNPALQILVGFVGNAQFDANVDFIDNQSKEKIGVIEVDQNSWLLGGFLSVSQTPKVLMGYAVKKIASEVDKAKRFGS